MRATCTSPDIREWTFTAAPACSRATEVRGVARHVSKCRGLSRTSGSDETNPIPKTNPIEPTQNRVCDEPTRFWVDFAHTLLRNEPTATKKFTSPKDEFAIFLSNSRILLQIARVSGGQKGVIGRQSAHNLMPSNHLRPVPIMTRKSPSRLFRSTFSSDENDKPSIRALRARTDRAGQLEMECSS